MRTCPSSALAGSYDTVPIRRSVGAGERGSLAGGSAGTGPAPARPGVPNRVGDHDRRGARF